MLVYFYVVDSKSNSDSARVMGSLLMIVVYYRAFSYLQMLDVFTALVGIINIIIQKLVIFFLILFYFYIVTALLLYKIDPENSLKMSFMHAYYWTLFGGVDDQGFTMFNFATIPIVFGTLMASVILLNVLIDFLSNLLSRLQEQQLVNDLKEKAGLLLDLEVVVMFFVHFLPGRLSRQRAISRKMKKSDGNKILTKTEMKYARLYKMQEKYLFIFKTVDFDELGEDDSVQDNLVNKIKMLEKKMDLNHRKQELMFGDLSKENAEIKKKLDALLKKNNNASRTGNPLKFSNIKPYYF